MNTIRFWGWSSRAALGVLVLAVLTAIAAGFGAWRLDPLLLSASDPIELAMAEVPARGDALSPSAVHAAVARDPFRPDRSRPANRYQLPNERAAAAARARQLTPVLSRMRLTGTAVLPDGQGLAAVSIQGGPSRVVRVGGSIEGLRLIGVDRGMAAFAGLDTIITFTLTDGTGKRRP